MGWDGVYGVWEGHLYSLGKEKGNMAGFYRGLGN